MTLPPTAVARLVQPRPPHVAGPGSCTVRGAGRLSARDFGRGRGEARSCEALVGRTVLYFRPSDGWVRGTVVRRSRAAGFSHVVRYGPRSALGAAAVTSLLDLEAHGPDGRWVLLCGVRAPGSASRASL